MIWYMLYWKPIFVYLIFVQILLYSKKYLVAKVTNEIDEINLMI